VSSPCTPTPVNGASVKVGGKPLAQHGYLGVGIENLPGRDTWYAAIPGSVTEVDHSSQRPCTPSCTSSRRVSSRVSSTRSLSPAAATNPTNQATRPESIVGVVRIAVQSTQTGPGDLLLILMAVNIFVGVLNMFISL